MRSRPSVRASLPVVAAFLARAAAAHDLWIEPSSFHPFKGEEVTAALRVGQHLSGEPLPLNPVLVDRFVLRTRSAELPMSGEPGADPAGAATVPEAGPQWIAYESRPFPVVLEAAKFEEYLKEEGLEGVVAERARRGQSAAPGRERFIRCAKALLDVPGLRSVPDGATGAPLGLALELAPRRNPYALPPGGELPVALTFRGAPLAGVLVVALCKDDPSRTVSARTDAKGLASLKLARAGFWLVKAVHMQAAPAGAGVDWESWWASITFELPARSARK